MPCECVHVQLANVRAHVCTYIEPDCLVIKYFLMINTWKLPLMCEKALKQCSRDFLVPVRKDVIYRSKHVINIIHR